MGDQRAFRVTLLGTGTSVGVPIIGCNCTVCTSDDPRDKRLRCSCLIEVGDLSILVDASPDFREQALRFGIERIDAVLFTHHHFDHIAGIDDLRPFLFEHSRPIPCYTHPETADAFRNKYDYIFGANPHPSAPRLELHAVTEPFLVHTRYGKEGGLTVEPLVALHGSLEIYGYRLGPLGYVTDASQIPESTVGSLRGVDVLVLNALRFRPHPSHLTIDQACELAARIGARQAYLIHMTHDVSHARDSRALPERVAFGYDGLKFEVR